MDRGCKMEILKTDSGTNDIVSVRASYALAGSLAVGLVFWIGVLALIF
jgi:hypothetical protein